MSRSVNPIAGHPVGEILGAAAAALTLLVPAAWGEDLYFSASAYAVGAGGSEWVHEVEVLNPSASPGTFELAWLPTGQDNSNPVSVELAVDPEGATRYENILNTAFGLGPSSVGALRVRPMTDGLVFYSRVLNVNGGDTFGQVIPAERESTGFGDGDEAVVLGLLENDDFRSNVWCVNTTGIEVVLTIELFRTDAAFLAAVPVVLPPLSNQQINRVFAAYAPVEGFIRLSTATPGGRAICHGAVISNLSNDAATELGADPSDASSELYLPYAVESATGSSAVDLLAPHGDTMARIELLLTDTDNTVPGFVDLLVPGGQVVRFDHVLADLFAHQGTAALRISAAGPDLVASSRTIGSSPAGPMIRLVPPVATGDRFVRGEVVALIQLREDAGFRTDVGFVNTSPAELDLVVRLYGETGDLLGSIPTQLLPFSHGQLDAVFSSVGHPSVPVGFATVATSTPAGSFVTYATVTDLNTQDAYHVTGRRIRQSVFADGFESGDTSAWSLTAP